MRRRLAVLPLVAVLALSGCGGDEPAVTEEGVPATPGLSEEPVGGNGLNAGSGDPLAPSDPTTNPSVPISSPSPS